MFPSRSRLLAQGITWEQLAFQFVIVLLGVYLAISLESCAERRNRQEDTMALLTRILGELRLDQAHFEDVIAEGEAKAPPFDALLSLMADGSNNHGTQIDSLLNHHLFSYSTAFPRRAAYTAMVSGGYLTEIPDQDLAVRLANLYEHSYERVRANGDLVDQYRRGTFRSFQDHWDWEQRIFLNPGIAGIAPARNAWRDLRGVFLDYYIRAFLPQMLEEVDALRAELESFLAK